MAYSYFFSLGLCFLLVFSGCSARTQQRQGRFRTECQIENLNAVEPKHRFRSEAGVTEFWDQNEEQFQCAGVAALRHKIQQRGLLLPSFNNAPQLIYVVQGRGIHGAVFPGCPETYKSQSQRDRQQGFKDQHQKVRQIKEGDIIAVPAGVAHWIYNNGESQLVLVSLVDVANVANQLDLNFRKFFLAGNPQEELTRGGQRQRGQEEEGGGNNLLNGFEKKLLGEAFDIDFELVEKLLNRNDNRGAIVNARNFDVQTPQSEEEEQRRQESEEEREREQEQERGQRREKGKQEQGRKGKREERPNGLEETFCTMRLKHQINNPSSADIFNPRAGRITTVNSYNLPILQFLQLSAEKGVLYRNALYAPHWNVNAHSVVYITRGNGRVQIVGENGEAVFDDQVEEGQIIVVPQNFASLSKAGNEGLEWVAFKTKANAKTSQIAGRMSAISAMPVDVVKNAYNLCREEAKRLKESGQEISLVSPSSQHQRD